MHIKLLCLGKSKGPFDDLARQYLGRLKGYAQVTLVEIPEVRYTKEPHPKERARILAEEGARIDAKLNARDHVIALDMGGKTFSSEGLADYLQAMANGGTPNVAFVIGGSLGLDEPLKAKANLCLSLSTLTLPHLLARVVLLEQVYRAFTILRSEPYHK